MADPITAFTIASVASAGTSAIAARTAAMEESAQQELNARLADTQALQRDTLAREELTRAESAVRAARGANGMSASSPNAFVLFDERREASDRDRLIARSDDRQRAANYRTAAQSAKSRARFSLASGLTKAAVPMSQYYAYRSG